MEFVSVLIFLSVCSFLSNQVLPNIDCDDTFLVIWAQMSNRAGNFTFWTFEEVTLNLAVGQSDRKSHSVDFFSLFSISYTVVSLLLEQIGHLLPSLKVPWLKKFIVKKMIKRLANRMATVEHVFWLFGSLNIIPLSRKIEKLQWHFDQNLRLRQGCWWSFSNFR